MFTKILTFLKPTENFRITSVHSKNIAAQIGIRYFDCKAFDNQIAQLSQKHNLSQKVR